MIITSQDIIQASACQPVLYYSLVEKANCQTMLQISDPGSSIFSITEISKYQNTLTLLYPHIAALFCTGGLFCGYFVTDKC